MIDKQIDYFWNVHNYLNWYIRVGDTKASVIGGISGAIVAWLVASAPVDFSTNNLVQTICFATSSCLFGCSFLVCLATVFPNLTTYEIKKKKAGPTSNETPSPAENFIFWENISAHVNKNTFAQKAAELDEAAMLSSLASHCHELAGVTKKKYWKIKLAVWLAIIGIIPLIIFFFQTSR